MGKTTHAFAAIAILCAAAVLVAAPAREYPVRAVPLGDIELTGGFWTARVEASRTALQGEVDRLSLDNPGRFYEAAVAHFEATGTRTLLDAALTHADRLAGAPGADSLRGVPDRAELTLGLIRLWIATGRPRYYDTARALLDQPASSLHFYSAITDVAALENDRGRLDTATRAWREIIANAMDITGSSPEPCAPVGHVMWNARLFLTTGRSEYIDVLERALYNALLARDSRDLGAGACAPSDEARTIAQMPGYIYAHQRNTLFVNLFAGSRARVPMSLGDVVVAQETNYPWDGDVEMRVDPASPREFVIAIREPKWLGDTPLESDRYRYADKRRLPPPSITVNGKTVHMLGANGYITIGRRWEKGDVIRVRFPMEPRRVIAHDRVTDNPGRAALERGPLVYALEAIDNGGRVLDLIVPFDARLESSFRRNLLGGVQVLTGDAVRAGRRIRFTAIPYFAWGNRGPGEMTAWVRVD